MAVAVISTLTNMGYATPYHGQRKWGGLKILVHWQDSILAHIFTNTYWFTEHKTKSLKVRCWRKLIFEENWLTEKFDWQRKLIDKESYLMMKVDCQERQLTEKVYWRRNLIDKESWLMKRVDRQRCTDKWLMLRCYCNWKWLLYAYDKWCILYICVTLIVSMTLQTQPIHSDETSWWHPTACHHKYQQKRKHYSNSILSGGGWTMVR